MADLRFQSYILDNTDNSIPTHLSALKKYLYYNIFNHNYNLHKLRKKVSNFKYISFTNVHDEVMTRSKLNLKKSNSGTEIPGVYTSLDFAQVDSMKNAEHALRSVYADLNCRELYGDGVADPAPTGAVGVLIPGILLNKLKLKTHQENLRFSSVEMIVVLRDFKVFDREDNEEISALFDEFYVDEEENEAEYGSGASSSVCRLKFILLNSPRTAEEIADFEECKLNLFVLNLKQYGVITTMEKELLYYETLDYHVPKPVKTFQGSLTLGGIGGDDEEGDQEIAPPFMELFVEGYPAIKKFNTSFTKKFMFENPETHQLEKVKHNVQYKFKMPEYEEKSENEEEEEEEEEDEEEGKGQWIDTTKEELIKGYRFQSNYVILPDFLVEESNKIRSNASPKFYKPGIQIKGCIPKVQFPRQYLMGETTFIVCNHASGSATMGDFLGFNALVQVLLDTNCVLLARYVSKRCEVSMCCLIPYELEDTHDKTLLLCKLPFSEDEKKCDFPSLGSSDDENEIEDELIKEDYQNVMDEYVRNNTIDDVDLNHGVYMKASTDPSNIDFTFHNLTYPSLNIKNLLLKKLVNNMTINELDNGLFESDDFADESKSNNQFNINDIYKDFNVLSRFPPDDPKSAAFMNKLEQTLQITKKPIQKLSLKRKIAEEFDDEFDDNELLDMGQPSKKKVDIRSLEDILGGFD
ncbi:hypothetical protein ACO0QE_002091 [Hanseniaspora vineae]